MNRLAAICSFGWDAQTVRGHLDGNFQIGSFSDRLLEAQSPNQYAINDIDLNDFEQVCDLKHWLTRKPKHAKVFLSPKKGSWVEVVTAVP